MTQKFVINCITGRGGGGHYAAYSALRATAKRLDLPWHFQITDMDEIITQLSQAGEVKNAYEALGISGHDLYNLMVSEGWTWLWPLKMRLNKLLVKLNYEAGLKFFERYWQAQQPDLVVSVMPLYNKGLWHSLQKVRPSTPYLTVLTDFADCPPNFWFDPDIKSTLVCGTQRAVAQAKEQGISRDRIVKTSGLVVHPDFSSDKALSKSERSMQRQQLGLDPHKPTALVLFGGSGSKQMLKVAQRLAPFQDSLQVIFLTGNNPNLATHLKDYRGPQKRVVVSFTNQVSHYMRLSDFFIGKPGNVSISEVIATKLPIITECNALTMSQEKYCAQWVAQQDVGIVLSSFINVDSAVSNMLDSEKRAHYKQNLNGIENNAAFEVVELMQQMLAQQSLSQHNSSQDTPSQNIFNKLHQPIA